MLKKVNRIKKRKDFEEIKMRGVMYHSPFFGLVILNSDEKISEKKFGYIVSKKISKRSVDRNKIKRLLSESVRLNINRFKDNTYGLFLAKKSIMGKKFEDINKILVEVIENIK